MGKARGKGPARSATATAMAKARNNPFEVKVNKQKFSVLGRRTKHDVGLPGISRSKALRKVSGAGCAVAGALVGLQGGGVCPGGGTHGVGRRQPRRWTRRERGQGI